jgi:hypothetical protein
MRLRILITSAVLAMTVAACGEDPAEPAASPSPTPPASSSTPSAEPTGPTSSADLELAPGRVGPITVGTSTADALETGLFDADVQPAEGCEKPLVWKDDFVGVDVVTGADGTITSLGVRHADGPRTADGLGVGSRFGELIETYGGDLSAPEVAGYGQVGVYVRQGDDWLGFLFGDATSIEQVDNDPGFEVTFAEATRFEKPGLMRDGC